MAEQDVPEGFVKIKDTREEGFVILHTRDFDPEKHELFDAPEADDKPRGRGRARKTEGDE